MRVLFVGINPGIRSEAIGHHFAGYSNRFWKLLHESRLVPEPIGPEDDDRLPEWGFGITNLVSRATPGIDTLLPEEFVVRRAQRCAARSAAAQPPIVALVGVTRVPASLFDQARTAGTPRPSARAASRARACSCCRIRADATPTSRTRRCWERFAGFAGPCHDYQGCSGLPAPQLRPPWSLNRSRTRLRFRGRLCNSQTSFVLRVVPAPFVRRSLRRGDRALGCIWLWPSERPAWSRGARSRGRRRQPAMSPI